LYSSIYCNRHLGPVWQVAWSHPKYENVIATSGYDKTIKIWKEQYG
jgi:protein transport protein SEC13